MGHAPEAVWSRALPLTAGCLSPLPGFEFWPGQMRELPVTSSKALVIQIPLE